MPGLSSQLLQKSVLRDDRAAEVIIQANTGDMLVHPQFGLVSCSLSQGRGSAYAGSRAGLRVAGLAETNVAGALTGSAVTFKPWVQTISTSLVYRFNWSGAAARY